MPSLFTMDCCPSRNRNGFFALLESRCAGAYNAQPQSSARAVAKAVHRIKRVIDGAHDGLHVVKKLLACSGQGHASGCSVEQANAQVLLERAYRLGQSGRRDSQLRCGPGEMAVLGDSDECAQLGKVIALHHVDTHRGVPGSMRRRR